jgi:hypothetical protein
MTRPIILQLCDQIVDLLNTGSRENRYPMRFEAVRYFQPRFSLPDLEESLKVCVVPSEVERNTLSRSIDQQISTIQIGVLARVDSTLDAIDPYVALVDSIALSLDGKHLDKNSTITDARIAPIFDPSLLRDNQQFTSIVSVQVRSFL